MTSRVAGVLQRTQGSAVSHFGAIWTRDTFRINTLLIKYRTARAGSGAPHAQCCQVLGFPMEFGYFNTVVGGCFSFQKRVFYPPERDFYQGTPSKCDWASELVLSSNWAGFCWQNLATLLTRAGLICSENGHCTSDTKHTGLLRAILLIR